MKNNMVAGKERAQGMPTEANILLEIIIFRFKRVSGASIKAL